MISYTQLFSLITWTSAGLLGATAAVSGQNLGAGLPDRTIQAVHVASLIGLGVAVAVGVLFWTIPRILLGFFGAEDPLVPVSRLCGKLGRVLELRPRFR